MKQSWTVSIGSFECPTQQGSWPLFSDFDLGAFFQTFSSQANATKSGYMLSALSLDRVRWK